MERITRQVTIALSDWYKENNADKTNITNLSVEQLDGKLKVTLVLSYPGLFIGKAGRTIEAIREYVADILDQEIEFELIENKTWHGTYSDWS